MTANSSMPMPLKILLLVMLFATGGAGFFWLTNHNPGFLLFMVFVFADVILLGGYWVIRQIKNSGGAHD